MTKAKKENKAVIVSQDTLPLTAELAEHWQKMKALPQDRDLKTGLLSHLRLSIEKGIIIPFDWSSAEWDGKTFRVDGKHSSWLFSKGQAPVPAGAVVRTVHYKCGSQKALSDLYMVHNDPKSSKLRRDADKLYAASDPDLVKISSGMISPITTGLVMATREGGYRPTNTHVSFADRGETMLANKDFILWYVDKVMKRVPDRHMKRPNAVAAACLMWKADPKNALTFWRAVADGAGGPRDATRLLFSYLQTMRPNPTDPTSKPDIPSVQYAKCVFAWNAWVEGRSMLHIRAPQIKQVGRRREVERPEIKRRK